MTVQKVQQTTKLTRRTEKWSQPWAPRIMAKITLGDGLTWADFPMFSVGTLTPQSVVPEPLQKAHWFWTGSRKIVYPHSQGRGSPARLFYACLKDPKLLQDTSKHLMVACAVQNCCNPFHQRLAYAKGPAADPDPLANRAATTPEMEARSPGSRSAAGLSPLPVSDDSSAGPYCPHCHRGRPPTAAGDPHPVPPQGAGTLSDQDLLELVDQLEMWILDTGARTVEQFLELCHHTYTRAEIEHAIDRLTPALKSRIEN